MSRTKYILYIALVLAVILVFAFASQVRRLQKELRSSVRIFPSESKSDGDAQNGLDRDATSSLARPEILVKFRAGVSENTITEITNRFNDRVQDEIEAVPGLTVIDDPDNEEPTTIAAQYQALSEVEYAEPNYEITLAPGGNNDFTRVPEPRVEAQWALQNDGRNGGKRGADISAVKAWATTKGSSDVVVAILDSGVEYTHVDLVNNIWMRPAHIKPYQDQDLGTVDDLRGYNAVNNDGDPIDDNGQGTNCAGVIAGECDKGIGVCGVSPKTKIMPLRFFNAGGFGSVAGAVQAINYAVDRKSAGVHIRVLNISWGMTEHSRALDDMIRKTYEAGILVVAASGSGNTDCDVTPRYPAGFNIGNVISVAATDRRDELALFSNYGLRSVQVAAPGKDILTTGLGNDYELRSGTLMAAPMVTGVAALALSAHPNLSVDQLRSLLLQSIDELPGLRGKVSTGGRINAAKAVASR